MRLLVEIGLALPSEHAAILALHREAGWAGTTQVAGEVWAVREGGGIVGSIQLLANRTRPQAFLHRPPGVSP